MSPLRKIRLTNRPLRNPHLGTIHSPSKTNPMRMRRSEMKSLQMKIRRTKNHWKILQWRDRYRATSRFH